MEWGKANKGNDFYLLLYLVSYIFMLRVPSEALQMKKGPVSNDVAQSVIEKKGDRIVLHLKRRKNRPLGGTMYRECWCAQSRLTCPVHALGKALDKMAPGTSLFQKISASDAISKLRHILGAIGIQDAMSYRTHDLRRGHVLDMQESGVSFLFCSEKVCHLLLFRSTACQDYGICSMAPCGVYEVH